MEDVRVRWGTSVGVVALVLVCAVAVLVPSVHQHVHDGQRLALGVALVAAGLVLARVGRLARSGPADTSRT